MLFIGYISTYYAGVTNILDRKIILCSLISAGLTAVVPYLDKPKTPEKTPTKTTAQIYQETITSIAIVRTDGIDNGSGFSFDAKGDFLTTHHVIFGALSISIVTAQGSTYPATIVYDNPKYDFSVLHINAKTSFVPWAQKQSLPGETVIEIGDPFGRGIAITQGIVSSLNGNPNTFLAKSPATLQYDAATNPGNSGGVVMNDEGQVIGMADSIFSNSSTYCSPQSSGVAYAVPFQVIVDRLRSVGFLSPAANTYDPKPAPRRSFPARFLGSGLIGYSR